MQSDLRIDQSLVLQQIRCFSDIQALHCGATHLEQTLLGNFHYCLARTQGMGALAQIFSGIVLFLSSTGRLTGELRWFLVTTDHIR